MGQQTGKNKKDSNVTSTDPKGGSAFSYCAAPPSLSRCFQLLRHSSLMVYFQLFRPRKIMYMSFSRYQSYFSPKTGHLRHHNPPSMAIRPSYHASIARVSYSTTMPLRIELTHRIDPASRYGSAGRRQSARSGAMSSKQTAQ